MVLGLVLGGIASAIAGSAISSYSANRIASNQMAYNSALNKESYEYSRKLNQQLYELNYYQNKNNLANDKILTDYNYALQRESRQNTFQDTRKDLESAGYNPLLALGVQSSGMTPGMNASTSGQSNAGFSSADSDAVINAMSSASSAYNNTRQIDQLVRQTDSNLKSAQAQDVVNYNLAELYHSQERGQNINNTINDTYGLEKAGVELDNLKKDGLLKNWQVKQIKRNIASSLVSDSYTSALTAHTKQETENLRQSYDINEPTRRFAKSHPVAHGTLQRVNPVSALGSLAGIKYLLGGSSGTTIHRYHHH